MLDVMLFSVSRVRVAVADREAGSQRFAGLVHHHDAGADLHLEACRNEALVEPVADDLNVTADRSVTSRVSRFGQIPTRRGGTTAYRGEEQNRNRDESAVHRNGLPGVHCGVPPSQPCAG